MSELVWKECPAKDCLRLFGTHENQPKPKFCPYCGHKGRFPNWPSRFLATRRPRKKQGEQA